jgi:hypothetical protein
MKQYTEQSKEKYLQLSVGWVAYYMLCIIAKYAMLIKVYFDI